MKTANILWRDLLRQVRLFPLAVLFFTALPLAAQVPSLINYQGRLTDGSGSPVSGNRTMAVRLYDAATGGNMTYEETIGTVGVANGTYSFQFGASGNGIVSVLSGQDFLALTVNGTEESTRTRLLAVPYALKAKESADTQTLNSQVTSLNGTVAGLSASQTTLAGNVTTLSTQVSGVSSNATAALGAVSELSGNVTSLGAQVNTLSGNVTTLTNEQNNKLAGLEAAIKTLRDDLAAAGVLGGVFVNVQGGTLPQGSGLAGQTVATFQIGKYEVTWGEWREVRAWAVANGYIELAGVGDTYPFGSDDNFPVINVSWYDVVKWMNARSEKEGLTPVYQVGEATYKTGGIEPTVNSSANGYRLPTEVEWEWAARGGASSQGYIYSGSNDVNAVAWYYDNSSNGTKAVGLKAANELGIYDMSGNVWEWCEDIAYNTYRRFRGGSWYGGAGDCTVAYRDSDFPALRSSSGDPDARDNVIGFRLARSSGN